MSGGGKLSMSPACCHAISPHVPPSSVTDTHASGGPPLGHAVSIIFISFYVIFPALLSKNACPAPRTRKKSPVPHCVIREG